MIDVKSTLFIVATPIGNLSDMSERAISTLKDVDTVFAERPNWSLKLFNHFDIHNRILQYSEATKDKAAKLALTLLEKGCNIALISDAGTPIISDPGSSLVEIVRKSGYKSAVVPGPSAMTAVVSMFGTKAPFLFLGFLPRKRSDIIKLLEKVKACSYPAVFYESPHRIIDTLSIINDEFQDAELFIGKELTKINEAYYKGRAALMIEKIGSNVKGEFTGIISIKSKKSYDEKEIAIKLSEENISARDVAKCMKLIYGTRKKKVYEWI